MGARYLLITEHTGVYRLCVSGDLSESIKLSCRMSHPIIDSVIHESSRYQILKKLLLDWIVLDVKRAQTRFFILSALRGGNF